MVSFRIILLGVSIFNAYIWNKNDNSFISTIFIILSLILATYIIINDIKVKKIVLNIQEYKKQYIIKVNNKIRTYSDDEYVKAKPIEVDFNKIIIFLLIVIIIILLYNNGALYKLKLIKDDNILEIISSNKLTSEEKIKISYKIATLDDTKYINKPIWYVLYK